MCKRAIYTFKKETEFLNAAHDQKETSLGTMFTRDVNCSDF